MAIELFGTATCPYTAELRAQLEFDGKDFTEYDIEADESARGRLVALCGSAACVPILVEDDDVKQVGWQGRTCFVGDR
jgi:mycoredoxin